LESILELIGMRLDVSRWQVSLRPAVSHAATTTEFTDKNPVLPWVQGHDHRFPPLALILLITTIEQATNSHHFLLRCLCKMIYLIWNMT
jgi:hypothetical protein